MTPLSATESWKLWDSAGRYRGKTGAELLKPYPGCRLTAYERFYIWNPGPLHWVLITITERFVAEVVGPKFESKTEALIALPALARKYDCVRTGR